MLLFLHIDEAALVLTRCTTDECNNYSLLEDFRDTDQGGNSWSERCFKRIFGKNGDGATTNWGPMGFNRIYHPLNLIVRRCSKLFW